MSHAPHYLRSEHENEVRRQALEASLLETGWRELRLKWLERGDHLYEKKDKRILTDDQGAFVYKRISESNGHRTWKRHLGVVGYNRGRVLDAFERRGKTDEGEL